MYGDIDRKYRFEPRMSGSEVTCERLLCEVKVRLGLQVGPFGDREEVRC